MDYYWELTTTDGGSRRIPPNAVPLIQQRLTDKGIINLPNASIQHWQVESFRQTAEPYGRLIEEVAQVFHEPVVTEDGEVKARWVKRQILGDSWYRQYSKIPAYRKLEDDGNMVTMAFTLPVHQIDTSRVQYCTTAETYKLNSK